jgi:hypothetical protein
LRTVFSAELHIDGASRPEDIAAEAIYQLALALAPEPKRLGLADLPPQTPPSQLFDGPLALNGFIAGSELGEPCTAIAVADLAERLADLPTVVAVRHPGLWVEGFGACADGHCEIESGHFFSLDAGIEADRMPLRLVRGGRPCPIDNEAVLQALRRLWTAHRRRQPLKSGYRALFPSPRGRPRELGRFTPVASQFPAVYRLDGGDGPPSTPAAGQLLGFLSLFEMLMVDYCRRLDGLASLVAGAQVEPASSPADLRARIPALAHLVPPGEPAAAPAPPLPDPADDEAMLDLLLALYGEAADVVPLFPPRPPHAPEARRRRIAVKRGLLGHIVSLARRRGRGFDYRAGPDSRRVAGVELRMQLLLGDDTADGASGRRRIAFVEHMMLRPRTAERLAGEAGAHRYGLAVSAVVELLPEALVDREYRRQLGQAIRDELPAHVGLHLHFVDRTRWRHFHRVHRLWRLSLQLGELPAVDWSSAQLRDMLHLWAEETRLESEAQG